MKLRLGFTDTGETKLLEEIGEGENSTRIKAG